MRYHHNYQLARQEMLPQTLFNKKKNVFGYFKLHGKQQDAVNTILENNDCVVLMPTDGGKTVYYEVFGIIILRFTVVVTSVICLYVVPFFANLWQQKSSEGVVFDPLWSCRGIQDHVIIINGQRIAKCMYIRISIDGSAEPLTPNSVPRNFGFCLLQVVSTDLSVDIAVDSRSTLGRYSGRQSVDTRSIVSRDWVNIAVDSRSRLGRYSSRQSVEIQTIVGRHSVETRSMVVPDASRPIQLFVHRYFTDTSPTFRRHFADSSSIFHRCIGTVIGQYSVDGRSTLGRQSEDSKNTLKISCGDDGMVSLTPMAVLVD